MQLTANRALTILETYTLDKSHEDVKDVEDERPNPATTGFRYIATESGCSIRSKWALPSTAIARIGQTEISSDGCSKSRFVHFGNKQRTGMWVNLCLIHEKVIGYHLILNSEGHRDALIPIYKFFEEAPTAIWNDFGCGCEESGLNWLPHFFSKTQHFHDMFHGFSHLCPPRFSSRRLPAYSTLDTSVMEQVCFVVSKSKTVNFK